MATSRSRKKIVEPVVEVTKENAPKPQSLKDIMPPISSMGTMMQNLLGSGGNPMGEIMEKVLGNVSGQTNKLRLTGKVDHSHVDLELVDEFTLKIAQQIIEKKLAELDAQTTPNM